MLGSTSVASILIAAAILPTAFGSMLRRLDAESYQAVMSAPPPFCFIENGFDYVGNDLGNVHGKVEDCCDKCAAIVNCRAWSWSDYNGGTCWLKTKVTQIINKPGVKSAQAYPDIYESCLFPQFNMDFVGNDIANKPSATYAGCCDICKTTPNCRAYSWSNHNGGTCWLKSKIGQVVMTQGVTSAQVYPNTPQCTIEKHTDYVDNDFGNTAGKDATECCDKCRNVSGCHAFVWSNHNGGTCWLKSKKGTAVAKAGVSAGTI